MKINLKLYASLGRYLPSEARKNEVVVRIQEEMTVDEVLRDYAVPGDMCHLVLVNGVFIPPSERDVYKLKEGDSLAVWPPVAGG
tara:strand:- start:195 stop:446 length:252 start_codon:yes stop_codon:yes gene_type:complete